MPVVEVVEELKDTLQQGAGQPLDAAPPHLDARKEVQRSQSPYRTSCTSAAAAAAPACLREECPLAPRPAAALRGGPSDCHRHQARANLARAWPLDPPVEHQTGRFQKGPPRRLLGSGSRPCPAWGTGRRGHC
eukprot:scaffold626_cov409-Prasinococcus_capsulatus_cf.AAC.15